MYFAQRGRLFYPYGRRFLPEEGRCSAQGGRRFLPEEGKCSAQGGRRTFRRGRSLTGGCQNPVGTLAVAIHQQAAIALKCHHSITVLLGVGFLYHSREGDRCLVGIVQIGDDPKAQRVTDLAEGKRQDKCAQQYYSLDVHFHFIGQHFGLMFISVPATAESSRETVGQGERMMPQCCKK